MTISHSTSYFTPKSRVLSSDEIAEFGRRIDAIRSETMAKIGESDARYIYAVRDFVRYSELVSRSMLMFGGWLPPVWVLGAGLLGISKIVENMELGHNVIHGQFDWLNDPSLQGNSYDWDMACSGKDWRYTHNFKHHTYTNVLGRDDDVGYGLLRMTREQEWHPRFLGNLPFSISMMLGFQWFVAMQNSRIDEYLSGKVDGKTALAYVDAFIKKARRQILKDYVFFPIIAGPMFLPVLAGNAVANLMRNIWAFSIIFCGHFTEDVEVFEDRVDVETKAEWYLRQIKGSSNLTGGRILHFMSGNLSHQIEHHLFPDVPANRYKEMAPKVQAVCAEFGIHYNTGSFAKQFWTVWERIAIHSLPNHRVDQLRALWHSRPSWSELMSRIMPTSTAAHRLPA